MTNARRFVLAALPGDPERNALLLSDWDCAMAGEGGAVMTRGDEIHLVGAGITRARIREFLLPIVEKFGHARTVVNHGNRSSALFVKRLGFKAIGFAESGIIYEITRGAKCLQSLR